MSDGVFRIYRALNGRVGYPLPRADFGQPKKIRLQWQYLINSRRFWFDSASPPFDVVQLEGVEGG